MTNGIHDIWCRDGADSPWRVQVMLDEADADTWISRRHPEVRRPLGELRHTSASGLPFLAPEVQLFSKARGTRPRDEQDLEASLPHLSSEQRHWLSEAITRTAPNHPWLARLR